MIKKALFNHFNDETCPECEAGLRIRSGKHGSFLGCSNYPECNFVRPLKNHSDSHIVKVLESRYCPECSNTLVLRQGRYGMFIACSAWPACAHTEAINRVNETNKLNCPQCQTGRLVLRRSRYGKIFHACDSYPDCQFSVNALPVEGTCKFCHFPLLAEKKTTHGLKRFCANKLCGKIAKADNIE